MRGKDGQTDNRANIGSLDTLALSYTLPTWLSVRMRKPTPIELEFTMVLFLVLAPLGYLNMQAFLWLLS